MNIAFNEEQEELRRTVRRFLESRSDEPAVRRTMDTAEGYDEQVWKEMAEQLGLQGLIIPAEYGGAELGAGEIVLNSIDADGTKAGYDLEVTRRISESVEVPVVASGGAGCLEHMADVLHKGQADAVLAASIFHFGDYSVADVKAFLERDGIPVRTV